MMLPVKSGRTALIVALACALIAACGNADNAERTTPRGSTVRVENTTIHVAAETMVQAERQNFTYSGKLAQALKGDDNALDELLEFTKYTDAAGALGHAVVLSQLLDVVGDDAFAKAAGNLTPDVRQRVMHVMEAEVYRADQRDLIHWRTRAPLTSAALPDAN